MGSSLYWYRVPYQPNLQAALDELRRREFAAGNYAPAVARPVFGEAPPKPKKKPPFRTIDDAIAESDAAGTRSILDVMVVAKKPGPGVASPFHPQDVEDLFGVANPSPALVDNHLELLVEDVPRGECRYLVMHEAGKPTEILFAGWSYE